MKILKWCTSTTALKGGVDTYEVSTDFYNSTKGGTDTLIFIRGVSGILVVEKLFVGLCS